MAKYLYFECRGESFIINKKGQLMQERAFHDPCYGGFHDSWKVLGFSTHHWRNSPDISVNEAFRNPEKIRNTIVFDIDHGTVRVWGGSYYGKLPRVTRVILSNDLPKKYH